MNSPESKLVCRGCGAALEYSSEKRALKCQYCGTVTEIPHSKEELADAPQWIIPLTVDRPSLEKTILQHLASGKYTADDLLAEATFSHVEQFYVPAYRFTGSYEAQWTASFGYDRRETYTDYETRYEGGRSYRVPVTKSRPVTDWRPVNGTETGQFSVMAYGGSRVPTEVQSFVEQSRGLDGLTEFDSSYVGGYETELFTISEQDAFRKSASPQVEEIVGASVQRHAQGDRQRDWHWTYTTSQRVGTVFVPICHVTYVYQGKEYGVWTDGTDPTHLLGDALPEDQRRKNAVLLGFVPALVAAIAFLGVAVAASNELTSA
ncbi:MAG: hypothetical protein ACREDR_39660, partial [Blastocatellia bacterium]